jgi:hypothetical protein
MKTIFFTPIVDRIVYYNSVILLAFLNRSGFRFTPLVSYKFDNK